MGRVKLRQVVGKTCGTCLFCDAIQGKPNGYCLALPPQMINIMKRDAEGHLVDNWMCIAPEVKAVRMGCVHWEEKPNLYMPKLKMPQGKK